MLLPRALYIYLLVVIKVKQITHLRRRMFERFVLLIATDGFSTSPVCLQASIVVTRMHRIP